MSEILIIEDDERIATLVKKGLVENGFDVRVAGDGRVGRKLALQNPFDLVIIDIILPNANGIDLCKEIRSAKPNVPIIMLTALGTTDDKVEGFDAGSDDYIVKPFDFRELHARIRALMKRTSSEADSNGSVVRFADVEMNLRTRSVHRNNIEISLTPKEFKAPRQRR